MANHLEFLHPRSLKYLAEYIDELVEKRLWLKVLLGMVLGAAVGVALGPSAGWVRPSTASELGEWLALPGQIFLGIIQMIVVPLVFASIIRGLAAGEDIAQVKKLGVAAVAFFLVTTVGAIGIGIGLALLVKPGRFVDPSMTRSVLDSAAAVAPSAEQSGSTRSLPDSIVGILPKNPLGSMVEAEMLQVVIFAVIVGVALVSLPAKDSRPMLALLGSLQQICMTVVKWAMRLAPIAVFGLMARLTSKIGLEALLGLSVYVLTVLAGLGLLFVFYVIVVVAVTRQSPLWFLSAVREVQLLAFSTSSSAAVMPLSIKTAEERLGVRPSVSQFVIPLGATINMNGTALYQGVATMFLAQVFGIELSTGQLALVVITAVAASIGSPATPGVGIVILAMVLDAAGVPAAGIALLIGVDRILDMSRTAVNVTGDLVATVLLDRTVGGLQTADQQLAIERSHEAQRAVSGSDVIVGPGASTTDPSS